MDEALDVPKVWNSVGTHRTRVQLKPAFDASTGSSPCLLGPCIYPSIIPAPLQELKTAVDASTGSPPPHTRCGKVWKPHPPCISSLQDLRSAVDASTGLEGIKAKSKAVRLLIIQLYAKWQLQVRGMMMFCNS